MNTRKVRGKQAVEGLFNGHSSLLNFGQNKKKKIFFFPVKVIQWFGQSEILGEQCGQNPLFPMSVEAQKVHYCALTKSTDFEAYTGRQSCTFWLFIFLSIDPTPLSLYSCLLCLLQMLLCSQVVTGKGKLNFMAVSAQLPLPSVSFCHFKKSIFTKKKKKEREKTTTTESYGICPKLVGCPMIECHKDNSPLMLPKVGIFKMLLNVHFFSFH